MIIWTAICVIRLVMFDPPGDPFSGEARIAAGMFAQLLVIQWAALSVVLLLIVIIDAIVTAGDAVIKNAVQLEEQRRRSTETQNSASKHPETIHPAARGKEKRARRIEDIAAEGWTMRTPSDEPLKSEQKAFWRPKTDS